MPTAILTPDGTGGHGNSWTQSGGASKQDAVDPGDPIAHDDATSFVFASGAGVTQSFTFESFSTKVPSAKTVAQVTFFVRLQTVDAGSQNTVVFRSGDGTNLLTDPQGAAVLGPNQAFTDFSAILPPADGGDWTVTKADSAQIQLLLNNALPQDGVMRCTSVWLLVEYGETVTTVEPPDETARRLIRRFRFPEERYRLELGPRGEQIELWEDFLLNETFAPEATGDGFGAEEWEARLLRCITKTPNPTNGNVSIEAIDPRKYLTTFFWSGISDAPGKTVGTIRLDQGIDETFARSTKAWIPWSDGKVYEVAAGDKKHNHLGLLIERDRTNRLLNSAFHEDGAGGADVFASWTELLSGAGISAQTADPYFDDIGIVKQYARITNTSPVENRGLQQTTSFSFPASQWGVLAVVHEDSTGDQIEISIQNTTTGNYLQSGGTWAASPTQFAPWASRSTRTRDFVVFQLEATGSTLQVEIKNNTANAVIDVWQVDLVDDLNYLTSPILTTTAELTEQNDQLEFTNPLNQEAIPFTGEQFTIQAVVKPFYDSDVDLGVAPSVIRSVYIVNAPGEAADSFLAFREDASAGDNHFALHLNGDGGVKPTFSANDEIRIVHRRSSARGEHDLDADKDQIMVSVNGGTWLEGAQVDSIQMALQTDARVFFGTGTTGDESFDGYFDYFDVRPFVLTKEEAKDFP